MDHQELHTFSSNSADGMVVGKKVGVEGVAGFLYAHGRTPEIGFLKPHHTLPATILYELVAWMKKKEILCFLINMRN